MKIDADGYPLVNSTTYVKVGNALPDFTAALMNTLSFKGFSVGAQLEWKNGGDV
jgi:hypothetical protein